MNSEKRNQNFMEQKWTEKKEDGYRLLQMKTDQSWESVKEAESKSWS